MRLLFALVVTTLAAASRVSSPKPKLGPFTATVEVEYAFIDNDRYVPRSSNFRLICFEGGWFHSVINLQSVQARRKIPPTVGGVIAKTGLMTKEDLRNKLCRENRPKNEGEGEYVLRESDNGHESVVCLWERRTSTGKLAVERTLVALENGVADLDIPDDQKWKYDMKDAIAECQERANV